VKPLYRWSSVPASDLPEDGDNPLNYIRWTAAREDYVLLKLSTGNGTLEEALVLQLLEDSSECPVCAHPPPSCVLRCGRQAWDGMAGAHCVHDASTEAVRRKGLAGQGNVCVPILLVLFIGVCSACSPVVVVVCVCVCRAPDLAALVDEVYWEQGSAQIAAGRTGRDLEVCDAIAAQSTCVLFRNSSCVIARVVCAGYWTVPRSPPCLPAANAASRHPGS
jgi:hypothetical protein